MKIESLFTITLLSALPAWGGVQMAQRVSLLRGWNAVYLEVAPEGDAAEVFADWPVAWVAVYDPAAFLETQQYSGTASSEGTKSRLGYRIWRRGNPAASSLAGVPANGIYVCFATNAWSGTLYGPPCAPRTTWHQSSADDPMNLIGFSTYADTSIGTYFDGLDVGNTTYRRYCGNNPSAPTLGAVFASETFENGNVLVMDSTAVSDWSGVLHVSPQYGLDYGTNASMQVLTVRNDGSRARTVRVTLSLGNAANLKDIPPVPQGLQIRDFGRIAEDPSWTPFSPEAPFEKRLGPGETLRLQIAVDRTALEGAAGTAYGALLSVLDVDGGSAMRATIPLNVVSDGGASAATAWPKGIWIATAELTSVTYVGMSTEKTSPRDDKDDEFISGYNPGGYTAPSTIVSPEGQKDVDVPTFTDLPAGGTMKVRLPMAVDREGRMSLLQRFTYGRDEDGVLHVYAGSVTNFPVALSGVSRVSTPFLPTDAPVVDAGEDDIFGTVATFPFVVAESSGVNPMRHALHPRHDGLDADFDGPAPSGDNLDNYLSRVKPELFSITNRVEFTWDAGSGTAWDPEETLSGSLVWEFDGLRQEGTLRAKGPFSMKRISPATLER